MRLLHASLLFSLLFNITCGEPGPTSQLATASTDTEGPSISAAPLSNSFVGSLPSVRLTVSEEVTGMDNLLNYSVTGDGATDLVVSDITTISALQYQVILEGELGNGAFQVNVNNITDLAGNPAVVQTIHYTADTINPTMATSPVDGSRLTDLNSVTLTFSTAVTGADNKNNYQLFGSGRGSAQIQDIEELSNNRYRVNLSGSIGNGTVTLSLINIEDEAGNALANRTLNFIADTSPAYLWASPSHLSTRGYLPHIVLDYSETVVGALDKNNYSLSGPGVGTLSVAGAKIFDGDHSYRIFFTGTPTNGMITLTIDGVTDLAGLTPSVGSVSYNMDLDNPTVIASPASGSSLNSISSSIQVNYSKPVWSATNRFNYVITGNGKGTLSVSSVSNLGGNSYRLNLSGTSTDGLVYITINNVRDPAYNDLVGGTLSYSLDRYAPTVTTSPAENAVVSSLSALEVTYSETVTGAMLPGSYSFSGSGGSGLSVDSVDHVDKNTYRLNINGAAADGDVTLTMTGIADTIGNTLSPASLDYRIDLDNPTVAGLPAGGTINSVAQFDFTFSETITGGDNIHNYAISGAGAAGLFKSSVTDLGGNTYRLALTGDSGEGNLQIAITGIVDEYGRTLSGGIFDYTVDGLAPGLTAVQPTGSTLVGFSQIDLIFDEPVTGADNIANYSLIGSGIGTLALDSVSHITGNTYRLLVTGAAVTGSVAVDIENVADTVGNILLDDRISYTIDLQNPLVATDPPINSRVSTLSTMILTYSESVTGADNIANYSLSGAGIGSLVLDSVAYLSGNSYQLTMIGSNAASGAITIAISNVTDDLGNPLNGSPLNYSSDQEGPSLASTYPVDTALDVGLDVPIQFIFNEDIDPATINDTNITVDDSTNPVTGTFAIILDRHVIFTPDYFLPVNSTINVTISTDVTDDIGNGIPAPINLSFQTKSMVNFREIHNTYNDYKEFTTVSDGIFFVGEDDVGPEIYKSECADDSTYLVDDNYRRSGYPSWGPDPEGLTAFNDNVYYSHSEYSNDGEEAYGTANGGSHVFQLVDARPGSSSSYPKLFTATDTQLFFIASTSSPDYTLYVSDGSGFGTSSLGGWNCHFCGGPSDMVAAGSLVYFNMAQSSYGKELFRSDGTAAGTWLVKDINPGSDGSYPLELTYIGSDLYFRASDGTHGGELWISNGSAGGTVMVKDINPAGDSNPEDFVTDGTDVYFTAEGDGLGRELWKTDGTEAGTQLVKDIVFGSNSPNITHLTGFGSKIYFATEQDGRHFFWESDGTENGTQILTELEVEMIVETGSYLYMLASAPGMGTKLWRTDGTAAGTMMVSVIGNYINASDGRMAAACNSIYARDYYSGTDKLMRYEE